MLYYSVDYHTYLKRNLNQQDVIILAMNPVQEHANEPAKAVVKIVAQVHAGINAKIRVMGIAKRVVLPPAKTLVYTQQQANLPINLHPTTISQVAMIVLVGAKTVAVLDAEPLAQEDAVIIAPEIVKPTVQITVLLRVKVLARQAAQEIVKERVKTHVWKPAKGRVF